MGYPGGEFKYNGLYADPIKMVIKLTDFTWDISQARTNKFINIINTYKRYHIIHGYNIFDDFKDNPPHILFYKWSTYNKKKWNNQTKKWDFVKTNYIKHNGVTNFIPNGTNVKVKKWTKFSYKEGMTKLPYYLGIRFRIKLKGMGTMTSELIRVKTDGKFIIKIY